MRVLLVGQPNCGKTTLFNRLTGRQEHTGNRAGVTVTCARGRMKGTGAELVDLPGLYSFTGGGAEEDDESLRARVLDTFRVMPNGANAAYYAQVALAVDGVAAVRVLPKNRGLGTVDVVVASPSGVPAQSLLDQVSQALQSRREIAVSARAIAPTTHEVTVLVQVKAQEGKDAAAVRNAVKAAIRAWFNGQRLGQDVLLAKLGQLIYGVDGVENYLIVSPGGDVALTAQELPVLGTLSVEELR